MAKVMSDGARSRLVWPVAGFFVVIAFGVGLISMAAFGDRTDPPTTAAGDTASSDVVEVKLGDLFIDPDGISAPAGPVTFKVENTGGIDHNFVIEGVDSTEMISPAGTEELSVDLQEGSYTVICAVPGHADGGMKATLTVGGDSEASGNDSGGGGMSGMTAQEMLEHDAKRTAQFPAETKGKGGLPLEPEILSDGTKRFELTADEIEWETEPGVVMKGMAYNGMIPGPQINLDLGDKVEVKLTNELDQPTVLHLHGMILPNGMDGVAGITQNAIMPGESFTYKFTARNSGTNMYHSHFNAAEQVPGGLLGALIISDPRDPAVDIDYTMVLNDGPLGFTINGKGFPATEPIVAGKDQLVRIRYMNEGLQVHPMHLHGIPQKVIAKDGYILKTPYMADTLLVAPGERYDVLVKATELGTWAYHCHILSHVEGPDGMFGMVTAMIVQ